MKYNVILMVAAAAVMAACSGNSPVTQLSGEFDPADQAPVMVEVVVGDQLDSMVALTGGRFAMDIPTDKLAVSYVVVSGQPIQFVADGSKIKIDLAEGTVSSSDKKGIQSRMNRFIEWQEDFMSDYEAKLDDIPEGERNAFLDQTVEKYNARLQEFIKENPDNVLGLMAVSALEIEDPVQMMGILNGLSAELKALPTVSSMMATCQTQATTGEGQIFQDFTVVQDKEDPQHSTVRFSHYVGQGKYVLVDFWASWCGPCREETPYLKAVYEKYKGDRFDMLSVAVSDEPENTRKAAEELGITWNQIINAQQIPGAIYGIQYIPHIMLIGPDGTIIKRGLRGEGIEKAVAEALAQ